ncbi:hypothetical protein [Solibacillus sp. R5-41]|uniref:hypothetical protein n=1 Tax=Solibacillus sp. R5-41 TaxID=2048654 RepID=UPI0012FE409C|nr:hypothetical protein [Solibacillus sp. R5-41]
MITSDSLHFTCGSSSLVLDGITDIQGQIVEMDGSIKAPVSISTTTEDDDDDDDFEQGLDLIGMILLAGGGTCSFDRIELYQTKDGQRVRCLFKGQITEMNIRTVRDIRG